MSTLPWIQPAMDLLRAARSAGRLPPALLIHESPGTGGIRLATYFAQLLLCNGSGPACGQCSGCRRVQAGEHPDLTRVGPDPESKLGQITVDQVRALAEQLALSSHDGQGTCVVIQPADALNRNAANALLKTLEEPRRDAHLLLVTTNPSLLPATIRSRCQKLILRSPSAEEALAWLGIQRPQDQGRWPAVLEVLGVAPLEALEADVPRLLELRREVLQLLKEAGSGRIDVIRAAEAWAKDDPALRLRCIENCLTAHVLAMRGGARLQDSALDMNIVQSLRVLDDVRLLQRRLATSLNKPLAMEDLLWRLGRTAAG